MIGVRDILGHLVKIALVYLAYEAFIAPAWMIRSHQVIEQTNLHVFFPQTGLNYGDIVQFRLPRWDYVRTYSATFLAWTMNEIDEGVSSNFIRQVNINFTAVCGDPNQKNKEEIETKRFYVSLGTMFSSTLVYRPNDGQPLSVAKPQDENEDQFLVCSISAKIHGPIPGHLKDVKKVIVMTEIEVIPHWSWPGWFPREFGDLVESIFAGLYEAMFKSALVKLS